MSLLDQIQEDLTSPSSNLSDILRRAKVLASKLKSSELRNWCSASTTFAGSVNYSCRFTPCF